MVKQEVSQIKNKDEYFKQLSIEYQNKIIASILWYNYIEVIIRLNSIL